MAQDKEKEGEREGEGGGGGHILKEVLPTPPSSLPSSLPSIPFYYVYTATKKRGREEGRG